MLNLGLGGHDSIETIAAIVIVIGGALFTYMSFRTRPAPIGSVASPFPDASAATGPSVRRSLVLIMAGLSAGAAFIHLAAAPSHYLELGDLASGFVIAAAFQGWWARACLTGPSGRVIDIGIVANLAIVAAWAWTRTVGLPLGEFAARPEPIGYPDAASVVFELLLVGALIARRFDLDLAWSRSGAMRSMASIAVVPVLGLVLVLTSLATVAIAAGLDHGAPTGAPAGQHAAGH